MAREAWEEVSFQVQFLEDGTIRSGWFPTGEGVVEGNIAVDYVWGNFPLQPDDDRTDTSTSFGGGEGDNGWSATYLYTSDTLRINDYEVPFNNVGGTVKVPADSHNIADDAWVGYPSFTTVPNVIGMFGVGDASDAQLAIAEAGLTVGTVLSVTSYPSGKDNMVFNTTIVATAANRGYVVGQYPRPGDGATAGDTVDLIVLDTDVTEDVIVPDVVGMLEAAATSELTGAGLVKGTVTTTAVGATTTNDLKVKTQTPAAGAIANGGSAVNLVKYAAPTVPSVLGLTESAAEAALIAANLVKGTVTTDTVGATALNNGLVKSQSPVSGGKANTGSAVNLVKYLYAG